MRAIKAKRIRGAIKAAFGPIDDTHRQALVQKQVMLPDGKTILPRTTVVNKLGSPKRLYRQWKRGTLNSRVLGEKR